MNSKMLLAFVGGLVVASGVTYIALKRNAPAVETAQVPVAASPTNPAPANPTLQPAVPALEAQPDTKPEPDTPSRVERAQPSRSTRTQRTARSQLVPKVTNPVPTQPTPAPAPVPQTPVVQTPQPTPAQQEVAKVELPQPPPYEPPPAPKPNTVTIPAGTTLNVRLGETLTSERNQPGDQFTAVLDQPLVVDGFVVAERGSKAQGRIVELERAGKVRGLARVAIELTQIRTSDGQNVRVNTSAYNKQGESSKQTDAAKVGGGAALGAIIGAIAGGGKGAAIGAGAGGAAGAGDVALTRGKPAEIRVETKVSFRMSEPVTITERLQ
jgi:hypothetical protein